MLAADEEMRAHRAAGDLALQHTTEQRLGDDAAVAQAAGELGPDPDAHMLGEEAPLDYDQAAASARAATERRKVKMWRCSTCGKEHAAF